MNELLNLDPAIIVGVIGMAITGVAGFLFKGWQERKANFMRVIADQHLAIGTKLWSQNPASGKWGLRGVVKSIEHGRITVDKGNGLVEYTSPAAFLDSGFVAGEMEPEPVDLDFDIDDEMLLDTAIKAAMIALANMDCRDDFDGDDPDDGEPMVKVDLEDDPALKAA